MHVSHHHQYAKKQDEGRASHHEWLCRAMREKLIEKGVLTRDELRRTMEWKETLAARGHENGARIVARAWTNADFRMALIEDGAAAIKELGLELKEAQLVVLPNDEHTHHVIVCTLCSCYPRSILGEPPMWYTRPEYRANIVRRPRQVLRRFGLEIPDDVNVEVRDSTSEMRYLVLPMRPAGTEQWDEESLVRLVSRDVLLGTALPDPANLEW